MIDFYKRRLCWGLHRTYKESLEYERILREVFRKTAMEVFGTTKVKDVGVFAYGSPGRFELTGGDADADVLIVEKRRGVKERAFRRLFVARLGNFDFSKIDLPPFGTYKEIDIFLEKSLVEGNQVIETRFICGDQNVRKEVDGRIKKFDSIERELRNIFFNRFYFNQYFRQRSQNGHPNVKYCPGGSREFLFFYWYDRLCQKINQENFSLSGLTQPKIKEGLERVFTEGEITGEEFGRAFEAINALIELRTDILILNRGSANRGVTLLNPETIEGLQKEFGYPSRREVVSAFRRYSGAIATVTRRIIEMTINRAANFRGSSWKESFERGYAKETSEKEREKIAVDDPLTRMAVIWGASKGGQKSLFDKLARRYADSTDWATICSLVCSPLCEPDILYEVAANQGKEKGYGYILRVIARNRNTTRQTLESIANDLNLEKRYSELATIALAEGFNRANNQV